MDSSGCKDGFASDFVIIFPVVSSDDPIMQGDRFAYDIERCSVNMVHFWTMAGILFFIRIVGHVLDALAFVALQRHRKEQRGHNVPEAHKKQRRISYSIVAEICFSVVMVIGFITVGLGKASAKNGWSLLILALGLVFTNTQLFFGSIKLVKLSRRMLPKKYQTGQGGKTMELEKIFGDKVVVAFYSLSLMCGLITIVFAILAVSMPGTTNFFASGMWSFGILASWFIALVGVKQTHRITSYIQSSMNEHKSQQEAKQGKGGASGSEDNEAMRDAIRRLWIRSGLFAVTSTVLLVITLLFSTFVAQFSWGFAAAFAFISVTIRLLAVFLLNWRAIKKKILNNLSNNANTSNINGTGKAGVSQSSKSSRENKGAQLAPTSILPTAQMTSQLGSYTG